MLRDLNNNVGAAETTPGQLMGQQYESFAGLNLTQPLLKNAGWGATTAKIRLSAISSKIAFHEYRRQILLVLASAEAAYWDLHLAQEQVRIGTDFRIFPFATGLGREICPPRICPAFTRVRTERMMPAVETGNLYPL
jgi:hypothetical protein